MIISAWWLQTSSKFNRQDFAEILEIPKRADRENATEMVDSGLIPGRAKPKTIKIGIHSFSVWRSATKGTVWSLHRVWQTDGQVAAWLEDQKVPLLYPGQGNLMNKM